MEDLTLKEKILQKLLESPKTTGELTVSLGYEKGKYNAIDKDLKTLVSEHLISHEKRKADGARGQPPTLYDVVYEIPILQKMWVEYEDSQLSLSMQKNEKILSMLVKKCFSEDVVVDTIFKVYGTENGLGHLFKKMLQLSPTFFRMCLLSQRSFPLEQALKLWLTTTPQGVQFLDYSMKTKAVIERLDKEEGADNLQTVLREISSVTRKRELAQNHLQMTILMYFESFLGSVRVDYFEGKIDDDVLAKTQAIILEFDSVMEGLVKFYEAFSNEIVKQPEHTVIP